MSEIKQRKRRFWLYCLAALLVFGPALKALAEEVNLGSINPGNTSGPTPTGTSSDPNNDKITWSLSSSGYTTVKYYGTNREIASAPKEGYSVSGGIGDSEGNGIYYGAGGLQYSLSSIPHDGVSSWNITSSWEADIFTILLTPTYTNYTLKFDSNGGGSNPTDVTFNITDNTIELPTPTWEGHTFLCWSYVVDPAESPITFPSTISAKSIFSYIETATNSLTLQAIWMTDPKPVENTPTYDGEGHELVTAANDNPGILYYRIGNAEEWTTSIPSATDAGTYSIYYYLEASETYSGGDYNYVSKGSEESPLGPVTATINPKEVTLTWGDTSLEYNGEEKVPKCTASGLVRSDVCDVTVTGAQTNAGSYTATASGLSNSNYKLPSENTTKTFEITKADPTYEAPTAIKTLVFTGAAQELINAGSTEDGTFHYSLDGTNYSETIPTGTNADSYTVRYKLIGDTNHTDVEGEISDANIGKANFSEVTISDIDDQVYTGAALTPSITVKLGDNYTLTTDDYEATYSDNIDVGTATVTLSPKGNNFAAGEPTPTTTFNITQCPITESMITLTIPEGGYTYDGTAKEPAVTVKNGEMTLTSGTDYNISYADNTNAGTAKVTVTAVADGNYSGSINKEFAIAPSAAPLTVELANPDATYTYDGTAKKPAVTVKSGETTLIPETDYTLVYTDNINAGTAKVTANGKGNYAGATGSTTFTINKADATITSAPSAIADLVYTGAAQSLITAGAGTGGTMEYSLTENGTFSTTIPTGTDAGEYHVYYKIVGDNNHNDALPSGDNPYIIVNIDKAQAAFTTVPQAKSIVFTGVEQELVTAGVVTGGTIKYSTDGETYDTAIPKGKNAGEYTVYYKIEGNDNYDELIPEDPTIAVTISAADFSTVTISDIADQVYTGTALTPSLTVKLGDYTLTTEDYEAAYSDNTYVGTATVKLSPKGSNFAAGATSPTKTFNITKATYDMSGITFADGSFVYDGQSHTITISGTLPTGVTVTYENNERTDAGSQTVTAKFTGDAANYEPIADMTATLTITKATYDMSGVTFENASFVYDGQPHTIAISGTLPEGVTVTYENNEQSAVGSYEVTAKFSGDATNYEAIDDMTATLTIIDRLTADNVTFVGSNKFATYRTTGEMAIDQNLTAYVITSVSGSTVTAQPVTHVEAETTLLVENAASGLEPNLSSSTPTPNLLLFAESGVTTSGTEYVLFGDEFVVATGTIPAGKCYLNINAVAGSRLVINILTSDGTTGIGEVISEEVMSDQWFDMKGQRINRPTKAGLYIKNGKKVIVK